MTRDLWVLASWVWAAAAIWLSLLAARLLLLALVDCCGCDVTR